MQAKLFVCIFFCEKAWPIKNKLLSLHSKFKQIEANELMQ